MAIDFDDLERLPIWEKVFALSAALDKDLQQAADEFKIDMDADTEYRDLIESVRMLKARAQFNMEQAQAQAEGEKYGEFSK